jgi:hypothetical protein
MSQEGSMKARRLRELLDTNAIIADFGTYIGIGSQYVHDIISIDKETRKVKLSDIARSGARWPEWESCKEKLKWIMADPEFNEIVEGNDPECDIPVFFAEKGEIVQETTDVWGWPNVTHTGKLMYENTFFKTKEEAVEYGIEDAGRGFDLWMQKRQELIRDLDRVEGKIKEVIEERRKYKELQQKIK